MLSSRWASVSAGLKAEGLFHFRGVGLRLAEGGGQPLEEVLPGFFDGVRLVFLDDLAGEGGAFDHRVAVLDEEVDLVAVNLARPVVFQSGHQPPHVVLLLLQQGGQGVEPGLLERVGEERVEPENGLSCAVQCADIAPVGFPLSEADGLPDVFSFEKAAYQLVGGFAPFGELLFAVGYLHERGGLAVDVGDGAYQEADQQEVAAGYLEGGGRFHGRGRFEGQGRSRTGTGAGGRTP